MSEFALHPESQLHYRHVVPPEWGPFVEAHATLTALSRHRSHVSVVSPARYATEWLSTRSNPRLCYIEWSNTNARVVRPLERQCLVALYALEALGDAAQMLPSHQAHWTRFVEAAPDYDAVLTYTPTMVEAISQLGLFAALYPLGVEPTAAGLPRWNTPKFQDYIYWGSEVGKRTVIVPYLKEALDGHIHTVSGAFGRGLVGQLDVSRAALHIAHSQVRSFPQWRAWQVLTSSACLVAELPEGNPPDTWPLVAGKHFFGLDPIGIHNLEATAERLRDLLTCQLAEIARRAWEELGSEFTGDKCLERYLVPASIRMLERRAAL